MLTYANPGDTAWVAETATLNAAAGTHTVAFQTTGSGGDSTCFDGFQITGGTYATVTLGSAVPLTSANSVLDLSAAYGAAVNSLSGVANSRVLLGATSALAVGADNTNTTFAGVISSSGPGLSKTGTGTFTLSGANTYTGGTSLLAGTLVVNSGMTASATGTGTVTLSGGTLAAGRPAARSPAWCKATHPRIPSHRGPA